MNIKFKIQSTAKGFHSFSDECHKCSHICTCDIRNHIIHLKREMEVSIDCIYFLEEKGAGKVIFNRIDDCLVPSGRSICT